MALPPGAEFAAAAAAAAALYPADTIGARCTRCEALAALASAALPAAACFVAQGGGVP